MGIAKSIESGLETTPGLEIGFVLIMTDAPTGKSGVATNLDRSSIAKLLRRALETVYSDN